MRKILLITTFVTMALGAFAQGTIQFANDAQAEIYFPSLLPPSSAPKVASGNLPFGGGPLVVGLLWGTSANSVVNLAGTAEIGTAAGFFDGNTSLPIAGTNPGDSDWFEVVAWDSSFGATLAGESACVLAGGWWGSPNSTDYGVPGGPLQFILGPTPGPGTVTFGSMINPGLFHLFTINITPEPSTTGLGALGAAALLLFRRRK